MAHGLSRAAMTREESHLFGLSGLVAVVCLAFVHATPGPKVFEIPEVIVPLGVSIALGGYTLRLQRRDRPADRPEIRYVWAGALVSAAVGVFWMGLHLYYGLPIDVLPDKILTVLSGGIAAGVFIGRSTDRDRRLERPRVVAETSWTTRSGSAPILETTVETLAEIEGVEPVELNSLYDHLNPEVFDELRSGNDSQWQLRFAVDEYEVRVSGHGTVTVYEPDSWAALRLD